MIGLLVGFVAEGWDDNWVEGWVCALSQITPDRGESDQIKYSPPAAATAA